jgi:hypothetical protein
MLLGQVAQPRKAEAKMVYGQVVGEVLKKTCGRFSGQQVGRLQG